jgi:hypothetical protein
VYVRILDRNVLVECADAVLYQIIASIFSGFAAGAIDRHPDLRYAISIDAATSMLCLARPRGDILRAQDYGDVVFLLEKDLTIELQRARSDLYFLHAAAISRDSNAWVLAADSGSGKSTLTWVLLHHGLRYLSDELAPVDLEHLRILPYPRALGLKRAVPAYPSPATAINFGQACYIPLPVLPETANGDSVRLAGVFFVSHHPENQEPRVVPVSSAEASARLYTVALNALAHADRGLQAAVRIAESVPCFALASADLGATAVLVRSMMDESGLWRQPDDQREPSSTTAS